MSSSVRLGNHELLVRLAAGGAANVFLARDSAAPPPGRLLAIKILLPSLASNQDFLQMFFAEARIASRLQHDNIVSIAGFGQVDGIHCLAMEYVFGASLAQALRASARVKRPLTVGVLLQITALVCDALHYAHELEDKGRKLGLVHRDVTPQNILIGFNGVPKLTDFGIAKATNRGWETQAGIVKGKFSYMSPEQALGKKVDRRSDIFGTGIVLWEALTGRDLFRGSTPMEVLSGIQQQKIDPPSKVVPGLTPIVDPIVMKALRRSPRARYQSALEMRADIDDLIRRAGVTIDAEAISREIGAIYGDEIAARALALRSAMAGKVDLDELARALGGQVLNPKHLPAAVPGGLTDPDPLDLFHRAMSPPRSSTAREAEPMPARSDGTFRASPSTQRDLDPIDDTASDLAEIARLEADADPSQSMLTHDTHDGDASLGQWDDSTAMSARSDELLSMLSEEDATVGHIPVAFASRFGPELNKLIEDELYREDDLTLGRPGGATPAPTKAVALTVKAIEHATPRAPSTRKAAEPRPPRGGNGEATGGAPHAPLTSARPSSSSRSSLAGLSSQDARPIPRAPSLDMDSSSALEMRHVEADVAGDELPQTTRNRVPDMQAPSLERDMNASDAAPASPLLRSDALAAELVGVAHARGLLLDDSQDESSRQAGKVVDKARTVPLAPAVATSPADALRAKAKTPSSIRLTPGVLFLLIVGLFAAGLAMGMVLERFEVLALLAR